MSRQGARGKRCISLLRLLLPAELTGCYGGQTAIPAPVSFHGPAPYSAPADETAVSLYKVHSAVEYVDLPVDLQLQDTDVPSERMVCTIHATPKIFGASGKYAGFLIDFRAENAPDRIITLLFCISITPNQRHYYATAFEA